MGDAEFICANGPFSVEENVRLLRQHQTGVIVTKDSGDAGGVDTKLVAAQTCGCTVVLVRRPPRPQPGHATIHELLAAVQAASAANA